MKKIVVAILFTIGMWLSTGIAGAKEYVPFTDAPGCEEAFAQNIPGATKAICRGYDKLRSMKEGSKEREDFRQILDETNQYDRGSLAAYDALLRLLPAGSPAQQKLMAERRAMLARQEACGDDLRCISRVSSEWTGSLLPLRKKLEKPLPIEEIRKLTRGWKVDGKSLYQRLVEGFSIYPLRQVTLADGRSIQWGFLPHAAQVQSVAVLSPKGNIEALATADDLYLSKAKDARAQLRIYLPHPQDLASLGALRSWAAASLLGFNQSCQGTEQAACTQALSKLPLIAVYDLHCKAKTPSAACRVPGEIGPGSAKDISLFWQ